MLTSAKVLGELGGGARFHEKVHRQQITDE
jgi:hypothetical protein